MFDVWESDLVDMQSLHKYNDGYRYLLTVIDVFTKYLHIVPLRSKTGTTVTSAFQSILQNPQYKNKRPIWLRTDKGKEFLNRKFQEVLKEEGIQFQVCKNPDIKCSVIERAHRTKRNKLYKYFTFKNTYRYIDVLDNFVEAYNNTHQSTTGLPPTRVTEKDVLTIWKLMNNNQQRIKQKLATFRVGQFVRISKEKLKFS